MIYKIMKWIFITFTTVILIANIGLIYFNYNTIKLYELREYMNPNSIEINTSNNLNINRINIYWNSETKAGQIVKNGKETNLIFKEYGPNSFTVLYEKDTIKQFTYFKTNNWHGHKHIISLSRNNENIKTEFKIIGPDIN